MKLWLRRLASFREEAAADNEFWQQMTADDRVAVVEQLRAEWRRKNGRPDEGLRRIVEILRFPRS